MITFWLAAAGLFIAIAVALLFVLPPLLRKMRKKPAVDPRSAVAAFLSGRMAAVSVGIAIPVLAVMLYFIWPAHSFFSAPDIFPEQHKAAQGGKMAPEHAQVVQDMAARMEQNPGDGMGWYMLAQSYAMMGQYADAVIAFEKAVQLIPNDAQLLVDYADVMAVVNDRNLRGRPLEMVRKALKINPKNIKGLTLMGTAAFQAEDYASAVKYWGKVLKLLPPDSPFAGQISSGVADARALAAGKQPTPEIAARSRPQPDAVSAKISGIITLSPALAGKAAPSDSLFVSAKTVSGPPMPIALMRAQVKDLPLRFTLDDSMAVTPDMKLSDHQVVTLSAKISKLGESMAQPGDLKGEVIRVKVGAKDVLVVIDKVMP